MLTRRKFLNLAACGLTTWSLNCSKGSRSQTSQYPNIVFIMADDMGFGDVSCYGATKIQTAHLDQLASQGIRLTNAHTPGAICQPTRYGVMTGRYFWRSEKAVAGFEKRGLNGYMPSMIESGRMTVPALLKEHGYTTACIGKWHLGVDWPTMDGKPPLADGMNVDHNKAFRGGPLDHGFDTYFGLIASLNMPPYCFCQDDHVADRPNVRRTDYNPFCAKGLMAPGWRDEDVGPVLTRKAVQFILDCAAEEPVRPFFLYLALSAPHAPCVPPDFIRGKSRAGVRGDMVAEVDWSVGQVMQALDQAGIKEDTLIMVTSDNGAVVDGVPSWRVDPVHYQIEDHGHRPNGYLRGQKGDTWEGGHRVPFVARWPGKIKPGLVRHDLICMTDLLATCAAIVGATLPKGIGEDSVNILPVIRSHPSNQPVRESVIHHAWRDKAYGITHGKWKLIDWPTSGGFMGPADVKPLPGEPAGQLYDIVNDPCETRNLWQHRPDIVKELKRMLEDCRK